MSLACAPRSHRRPLVFALLGAWAVIGAACSEDSGTPAAPASNTGRLAPGESCSVDAECQDGLACHPRKKQCICTSDEGCPDGLSCAPITGLCVDGVPGCGADSDCGDGSFCDEASRVCRAIRAFCDPCSIDEECGAGNKCVKADGVPVGFCGAACGDGGACDNPKTRCADGQCVPVTTCEDVQPCVPDTLQTCDADADCTEGVEQFCDISIGQCLARASGCSFGLVCNNVSRSCEPSCTGDGDCQANQRCINSLCQEIARCESNADCAQNKVCRIEPGAAEGECVSTCRNSADCPLSQICARGDDGRLTCRAGCATNGDCAPNERCDTATRACVGGAGVCQINDVCSSCQVCNQTALRCVAADALYCSECNSSGLDASCGPGGLCLNGSCLPQCPDTGCPRGFLCRRFTDQQGAELTRACAPNDGVCDTECN